MGLLANFNISGSAVSAQSLRLNTVASNLANVETITGSEAAAYRSRQPVFQAMLSRADRPGEVGVHMLGVIESHRAVEKRYDPGHRLADEDRRERPRSGLVVARA